MWMVSGGGGQYARFQDRLETEMKWERQYDGRWKGGRFER